MRTDDDLFRILVGIDGSRPASIAVDAVVDFPWREPSEVQGVVATRGTADSTDPAFRAILERASNVAADRAKQRLTTRWPAAEVYVREGHAADVILATARHLHSDVIAVGWRGTGPVRRLLAGSVSRAVVRRARCPVLVVRRALGAVKRVLIGYDGSLNSDAAVQFVSTFRPMRGGRVRLVTAIDEVRLPSNPLLPNSVRQSRTLGAEISRMNRERSAAARTNLESPAALLSAAGWKVESIVRPGAPLRLLLDQVGESRADIVIVGATGADAVDRLLLGSVAEGLLNRCPVSVLITR
jgi:nucleotide-binding universal stress UspA family protein